MIAGKWNYEAKTYDPYELPEGTILYTEDMETMIRCAQCSRSIKYGESYTSKEIHTSIGLGYPVCNDCYQEEVARSTL